MGQPVVVVDHVSKKYRLYRERNASIKVALLRGGRAKVDVFWAIEDVSFQVEEGSTTALIGENGSGKSTMLKCLAKILRPDKGSVKVTGKMSALLELGAGFHPELSGRENVFLNGAILGLKQKELLARFDDIVDFAGIGQFIDEPVKNYSSGMYVRLGFSVAINVNPDILIVDEVLAVGDEAFQRKCLERFSDLKRNGKTVIIVSHAMTSVVTMCDHAIWFKKGHKMADGSPERGGRGLHRVDRPGRAPPGRKGRPLGLRGSPHRTGGGARRLWPPRLRGWAVASRSRCVSGTRRRSRWNGLCSRSRSRPFRAW